MLQRSWVGLKSGWMLKGLGFPDLLQVPEASRAQTPTLLNEGQAASVPLGVGVETQNGRSGSLKCMISDTSRKAPAPPLDLRLQNRFSALLGDGSLGAPSHEAPKLSKSESYTRSTGGDEWQ